MNVRLVFSLFNLKYGSYTVKFFVSNSFSMSVKEESVKVFATTMEFYFVLKL